MFPIEQQGPRLEVPEFTAVHVEHFKPKWANHPLIQSPLNMVARAVLKVGG
jgi:hypothetical protein